MSDLAICDYFKWTLNEVYNLSLKEYLVVVKYLKKVDAKQKSDLRKSKRKK